MNTVTQKHITITKTFVVIKNSKTGEIWNLFGKVWMTPTNSNDVCECHLDNTHKKHVLEYVAKWLDGEKIQYKLTTTPDDDKQWHNFTQGAFQYIKRSDIHFRIAPKFVELNGTTFKSIDSLIKHVKNNYDMNE